MTKYIINSFLWVILIISTFSWFTFVLNQNYSPSQTVFWAAVCISVILLHYNFNFVHIASHMQLSRNRKLNSLAGNLSSIIGGITFADFRLTHNIHHRSPTSSEADPDHWITTSGGFFTIPFKIFYHDYYFWRKGIYKTQNSWIGYVLNRTIQVLLVIYLIQAGLINNWLYYWLLPMYIVGFLNGMFLFYFPHYTTKIEESWRASFSSKPLNVFNYIPKKFLNLVDISRVYHELHHDKVGNNRAYFPIYSYIVDNFKFEWSTPNIQQSKYINYNLNG